MPETILTDEEIQKAIVGEMDAWITRELESLFLFGCFTDQLILEWGRDG